MQPTGKERRRHTRHKLENSVSISTQGIFQIEDISRGGFRFKCPPYTSVPDSWETDILTSTASLFGFPVEPAWVSIVENGNNEYLPIVIGAKFGSLTEEQDSLLSQLIDDLSRWEEIQH